MNDKFLSGSSVFSGRQFDSNPPGRHPRAVATGEVLRADLQRDLALHPQRLRGLRILPVSLLSDFQPGDRPSVPQPHLLASLLDFHVERFTQVKRHSECYNVIRPDQTCSDVIRLVQTCLDVIKLVQRDHK